MAKYTINDTTLTAIADAIREKSGTTGGIDPADMAALIAAIESGGVEVEVGTFVPAESTQSYTVEFEKSHTNEFDLLICMNFSDESTSVNSVGFILKKINENKYEYRLYSRQYNTNYFPKLIGTYYGNEFYKKWEFTWSVTGESSKTYAAGATYLWLALWGVTI